MTVPDCIFAPHLVGYRPSIQRLVKIGKRYDAPACLSACVVSFRDARAMSSSLLKADLCGAIRNVGFGPIADIIR
jgi:hypothetical protein